MTHTECAPTSRTGLNPAKSLASQGDQFLYWLAFSAAVSILFSIAVSQILLALGSVGLLVSRRRLRFPPIVLPLAVFFTATVIADLLSGDPLKGIPQIRKFFVFGIVLLLFNTFHTISQIRSLVLAWASIATLSALFAVGQFLHRWNDAVRLHATIYDYVLDGRITGFASHWMTYGGEQMVVFLVLLAWLIFGPRDTWKIYGAVSAAIIWIAIVLGLTRSVFLAGLPLGVLLLIWNLQRRLVWTAPVAVLAMFLISPAHIRDRVWSVFHPHVDVDSNSRRTIMTRTGLRMIGAHPIFGIGPEQIQPQFLAYLPSDISQPLPKGWYGHLHNTYLQYAAERGLPALGCVLWMIGKMARDFTRALRFAPRQSECRFTWLGALAVIVAILTEGFFEYNLGDSEVLTMFLATMTCGYVAIRSGEARLITK